MALNCGWVFTHLHISSEFGGYGCCNWVVIEMLQWLLHGGGAAAAHCAGQVRRAGARAVVLSFCLAAACYKPRWFTACRCEITVDRGCGS